MFTRFYYSKFEGNSLFYSIKNKNIFKGKTISIFGGGDSALDWAVEFSKTSKVNLIHRREEFRGAQATVDKVMKLKKEGKIELFTKYQLKNVIGDEKLQSIEIINDDEKVVELKTDIVFPDP